MLSKFGLKYCGWRRILCFNDICKSGYMISIDIVYKRLLLKIENFVKFCKRVY